MKNINEIGIVQLFESGAFRHINPSVKVDGAWQSTDTSSETQEVKDFCVAAWTPSIKQEYQDYIDANLVV